MTTEDRWSPQRDDLHANRRRCPSEDHSRDRERSAHPASGPVGPGCAPARGLGGTGTTRPVRATGFAPV